MSNSSKGPTNNLFAVQAHYGMWLGTMKPLAGPVELVTWAKLGAIFWTFIMPPGSITMKIAKSLREYTGWAIYALIDPGNVIKVQKNENSFALITSSTEEILWLDAVIVLRHPIPSLTILEERWGKFSVSSVIITEDSINHLQHNKTKHVKTQFWYKTWIDPLTWFNH